MIHTGFVRARRWLCEDETCFFMRGGRGLPRRARRSRRRIYVRSGRARLLPSRRVSVDYDYRFADYEHEHEYEWEARLEGFEVGDQFGLLGLAELEAGGMVGFLK